VPTNLPISSDDAITIAEIDAPANRVAIPYTLKNAAHNAMRSAELPNIQGNLDFGNNLSFMMMWKYNRILLHIDKYQRKLKKLRLTPTVFWL